MSLLLRLTCFRSSVKIKTNFKRFYLTNHDISITEGVRIRYFIPRTANETIDSAVGEKEQKKELFKQKDYNVIYQFTETKALQSASAGVLVATVVIFYFLFNYEYYFQSAEDNKTKDDPVSEGLKLEDGFSSSEAVKEKDVQTIDFFKKVSSGNPIAKLAIAIMLVTGFFFVRSRIVLVIYRNCDDFITVFYQLFGIKKRLMEHRAKDCCYYPNKKILNYNLLGKYVIIFPECFVNKNEKQLYAGRISHE